MASRRPRMLTNKQRADADRDGKQRAKWHGLILPQADPRPFHAEIRFNDGLDQTQTQPAPNDRDLSDQSARASRTEEAGRRSSTAGHARRRRGNLAHRWPRSACPAKFCKQPASRTTCAASSAAPRRRASRRNELLDASRVRGGISPNHVGNAEFTNAAQDNSHQRLHGKTAATPKRRDIAIARVSRARNGQQVSKA